MKLFIKDGLVINPANNIAEKMDLLIEDELIAGFTRPGEGIPIDAIIVDAKGKWVVPGLIDLHVHFRDPGQTHKEDILSGCRAAAAGGYTTVCCMPNTDPVIHSRETVQYIDDRARRACGVNLLISSSITEGLRGIRLTDQKALIPLLTRCRELTGKGIATMSEDGKTVGSTSLMLGAMELAAELDLPVFSHTEEEALAGGAMNLGRRSLELGISGIPSETEELIVARDMLLAKHVGCRLHICHVSTKGSVDLIRLGKAMGIKLTAETAPHYFTLTDDWVKKNSGLAKMNPPLRSEEDRLAIIEGLQDGTIDAIATDHAPHLMEEKEVSIEKAAFGIVGLETAFALGYTNLVNKGLLTPSGLLERMSLAPAEILGIDRGVIAPGKVADLAVIDVENEYLISPSEFHSKGRNTPFGGMRVRGRVEITIVNGRIIYHDGSFD